jgi:2-dehydropantoate 2-reductase
MRSYTVIGLGAIGGYYGARLQQAGADVRFVVRRHRDQLRADGLRVESPDGDVELDLEVYDDPADVPPSDVIVVATKTTATPSVVPVVAQLAAATGPATVVVVMQNGLGVEVPFARAAPEATVVGAMCFMCSNLVAPGHVVHLDYGAVTLGLHRRGDPGDPAVVDPAAADPAAVEAVRADLVAGGVDASAVADLATGRWQKLVWNIPFNGLSVVLDAGTDQMLADPAVRARARSLMDEVVAGAAACGHPFDPAFADRMMAHTEAMTPYATSMKLDHQAGRALELDAIYAAPTAAARAAGAPMSDTEALLAELRRLDPGRVSDRLRPGTSPATPT